MLHHLLMTPRRTNHLHIMVCKPPQRMMNLHLLLPLQRSAFLVSHQWENRKESRHPCAPHKGQGVFKSQCQLTPLCRQFLLRSSVPACQMVFPLEWLLAWLFRNQSRIILLLTVILKMRIHPPMNLTRILIPWQRIVIRTRSQRRSQWVPTH